MQQESGVGVKRFWEVRNHIGFCKIKTTKYGKIEEEVELRLPKTVFAYESTNIVIQKPRKYSPLQQKGIWPLGCYIEIDVRCWVRVSV